MQKLKALEILKEIKNTFDENIVIGFTQKSINIDEDCIQALLEAGAKKIIFYSIGYTRRI